MKRVCAWCKRDLGEKEAYASEGTVTHGICSLCALELTSREPRSAEQILRYVHEPVFVIGTEGRVKAANRSALEMLGKEQDDVAGELGGDVFECAYASTQGGCGGTVHCKTCSVRNIVMATLSTGRGYKDVPAFQYIRTKDGPRVMRFHISTEKLGDSILLKIESVADADGDGDATQP